jgi:hypothetical protein
MIDGVSFGISLTKTRMLDLGRTETTLRSAVFAIVLVVGCGESGITGATGSPGGATSDASTSTGGTSGSRSSGGRAGSSTRGGTGGGSGGSAGASTGGTGGAADGGAGGGISTSSGGATGSGGAGPSDAGLSPTDICARLAAADAGTGSADAGGGATDAALTSVAGISLISDGIPRVGQAYIGFGASFRTSQPASTPGCTTRTVGACNITTCVPYDQVEAGTGTPTPPPPYRHAGQLRVRTVVSDPDADGVYPGISYWGRQGFRGGDRILYCALGGDVPAFASYLVGPGGVRVEATGSFPWTDNATFDRGVNHTLAWTAAGPGDVLLNISNTGFAGRTLPRVSVGCRYAADGSPGTIPAEVWQDFPPGDTAMSLRTINSDVVIAGSYRVPISATHLGPSIGLRF